MRNKIIFFYIFSIIYIIVFPTLKNRVLDKPYYVSFIVDGAKNESSKGTEVWIDCIYTDGEIYDLSKFVLSESDWTYTGRVFCPGNEPSVLETKIPYKKTLEIVFITHPYSGNVKVINNSNENVIDLYSPEEGRIICKFEK